MLDVHVLGKAIPSRVQTKTQHGEGWLNPIDGRDAPNTKYTWLCGLISNAARRTTAPARDGEEVPSRGNDSIFNFLWVFVPARAFFGATPFNKLPTEICFEVDARPHELTSRPPKKCHLANRTGGPCLRLHITPPPVTIHGNISRCTDAHKQVPVLLYNVTLYRGSRRVRLGNWPQILVYAGGSSSRTQPSVPSTDNTAVNLCVWKVHKFQLVIRPHKHNGVTE